MSAVLSTSQTGNGDSAIVSMAWPANVPSVQNTLGPACIAVTTVIGATPTVTINIQGSEDNVTWANIAYALVATPTTFVTSAIVTTTAKTEIYLLQGPLQPSTYQFVKLAYSANTNVTITASLYV